VRAVLAVTRPEGRDGGHEIAHLKLKSRPYQSGRKAASAVQAAFRWCRAVRLAPYSSPGPPFGIFENGVGKRLSGFLSEHPARRHCDPLHTCPFSLAGSLSPKASGMSKRILVVEDTENNRRILNDLLTNAGFEVMEAGDGEKGVAIATECRPDLILMDIQLPVVDGYQATRQIKSNPILRQIPIIAVTSYALSGDEAKARAAGCDGYVAKPFSPRVILTTVREFLK
jgi:two-component system cell cycle response regulator DivK